MMEDENEEVTMILAAETARTRRYDDLRRRPRPGEDKHTQTDHEEQYNRKETRTTDQGSKLLSYMAFSLVIGTLCQFKFFVSMTTDYFRYISIFVALTLTLVLQCVVAYILLYISKQEPSHDKVPLTFKTYLTILVASVTFINIVVFILI